MRQDLIFAVRHLRKNPGYALVTMAEVALAVVLVIGAGLLLRSFWNLMTIDAGFNRNQLVTFGVVLPASTYRTPQSTVDFVTRLTSELSSQSGVRAVAAMSGLPPGAARER
jgi:putative ABC transport system permease protein